jgi:ATP-dependent Zn protease
LTRFSRQNMVLTRAIRLRRTIQVDTNKLRGKALQHLEELFDMAKSLAQDKKVKLSARQKWAGVAAYLAQVINSVASGFDEKEIDVQLSELEKLIDEVKTKTKNGRPKK